MMQKGRWYGRNEGQVGPYEAGAFVERGRRGSRMEAVYGRSFMFRYSEQAQYGTNEGKAHGYKEMEEHQVICEKNTACTGGETLAQAIADDLDQLKYIITHPSTWVEGMLCFAVFIFIPMAVMLLLGGAQ